MRVVGLTGGIGSGKSTVSSQMGEKGAVVIDADAIVRELQQPGEAVFEQMVTRWGSKILAADGSLNRGAVAEIVFSDPTELEALEEIVHPVLQAEINRRIAAEAETNNLVILDMALLTEKASPYEVTEIIVVDLDPATAIDRLVRFRGFAEEDARKRINSQSSRDERLAFATHIINNDGDLESLEQQVNTLWDSLTTG